MAGTSTMSPNTGTGSRIDSSNSRMVVLDHPSTVMISAPLNENNWLSWSRSVRIALEGRDKLGFIDGTCAKLVDSSTDLKQWKITDSMLWDELVSLKPPAMCTCGKCTCGSKVEEMEASHLIQFLTGLNESYDNIYNQILVLEPLPHVNKAFFPVLRVERQRQVNMGSIDSGDNSALLGRGYEYRGSSGPKNNMRRKGPIDKRNIICENYNKPGHGKDTCFKLHGVHD
ncbi:UNVERIFIED_CONTAM: hypothetical protein Slati_2707500 [Sesamum latifolium]|uniref:Retrotransposon Copia-like N-terminal domain-containing protein n=1 Tax=Sesamum latifolium TaxID=2727402 RepID=A0AAW2VWJ3_9LAMI